MTNPWLRFLLVAGALVALAGCGGTEVVDPKFNEEVLAGADAGDAAGVAQPDVFEDAPPVPDGAAELPPSLDLETDGEVQEGTFGAPCDSNDDCVSGFCVETEAGKVCTQTCLDECPEGWGCVQNVASLPDLVYLCMPPNPRTCMPCDASAGCSPAGVDTGDRCVSFGEAGAFCGVACSALSSCATGGVCEEVVTVEGDTLEQCVPETGECSCTPLAVEVGASTTCTNENDVGVCVGQRTCTEDGLTDCDAPAPAAELCNGLDDDCNDAVDDLPGEACGLGACAHDHVPCAVGVPVACDPLQGASGEVCNAADDDCDGGVDEDLGVATCGAGVCAHEQILCVDGTPVSCDPFEGAGAELCDGLDDDCDGAVDEEGAAGCGTYYLDLDQDGFGANGPGKCLCAPDDLYTATQAGDCGPLDDDQHPGAPEICDDADNNCDGKVDENLGEILCGVGACQHPVDACDACQPMAGASDELCDGVDNDCDGDVDEGLGVTTCGLGECLHDQPNCMDGKPEACDPLWDWKPEFCDGLDNDCDGEIDEAGTLDCTTWYLDVDGDGFGVTAQALCLCASQGFYTATTGLDCKPLDPDAWPGAPETCNGGDDDCDGLVDEDLGSTTCGLGQCLHEQPNCVGGAPQACGPLQGAFPEICNGLDDDCDGDVDEAMGTTVCGVGECVHAQVNCLDGVPKVCDGLAGATLESCNSLDDDCDGLTDEEGAESCVTYYLDLDGDGFGLTAAGKCLCAPGELYSAASPGDCGPLDPDSWPGAPEVCDGVDNDCDGQKDEGLGTTTCGLGPCVHTVDNCAGGALQVCDPFQGAVGEICDGADNDCDDAIDEGLGTVSCGQGACAHAAPACVGGLPGPCDPLEGASPESCNGLDDDCDGGVDENPTDCTVYYEDVDGDGWGGAASLCLCAAAAPFDAVVPGDCLDTAFDVNPGAVELCGDALDNDCDPSTLCTWVEQGGEVFEFDPIPGVQSPVPWYHYGSPEAASANTGYEISNKTQLMLYEDDLGQLYLAIVNDRYDDGSGGYVDVTITGMTGASWVLYDDPPTSDTYGMNPVTGAGWAKWHWIECCTDGGILGPIETNGGGYEFTVQFTLLTGINQVLIRSGSLLQPVPNPLAPILFKKLPEP
ncbi:MAG: putative metal-binding motif-containing protein [Pseudomonadota bacterium]